MKSTKIFLAIFILMVSKSFGQINYDSLPQFDMIRKISQSDYRLKNKRYKSFSEFKDSVGVNDLFNKLGEELKNTFQLYDDLMKEDYTKSDLKLEYNFDQYPILKPHFYIYGIQKKGSQFYVYGSYINRLVAGYNYSTIEFSKGKGFIAEFSENFILNKLQPFDGIVIARVIIENNVINAVGWQVKDSINLPIKRGNSIDTIFSKSYYENDIVVLKLDTNFTINKFTHLAIDADENVFNNLCVNKNGFISFDVSTNIVRGPDHHDYNLFLLDSNLHCLWHKWAYERPIFGTGLVLLNDSNEVVIEYSEDRYEAPEMDDLMENERNKIISTKELKLNTNKDYVTSYLLRLNSRGKKISKNKIPLPEFPFENRRIISNQQLSEKKLILFCNYCYGIVSSNGSLQTKSDSFINDCVLLHVDFDAVMYANFYK